MKAESISVKEYTQKTSVFNLGLSKKLEEKLYNHEIHTLYDMAMLPAMDDARDEMSIEELVELTNFLLFIAEAISSNIKDLKNELSRYRAH